MFKQGDVDKWLSGFNKGFNNLENSIDVAGDDTEEHLTKRTTELTPTDTRALINSRRAYQELTETSWSLYISYNEDGNLDYAITEHEDPYGHDYQHNPPQVRALSGQPLLYLYTPLIQERNEWWKQIFSKVGWK